MNRFIVQLLALALSGFASRGIVAADEPLTIDVWPGVAPGEANPAAAEPDSANPAKTKRVSGVTHPTLTIVRPAAEKDARAAVLVCPGGGYKMLAYDYEGEDVAKWLSSLGVTGIVLKYRVPPHEGVARWQAPLQDAQRSLSFIRSKAKEWNIDPSRIGMLGFSAGGHLTAAASNNSDKRAYERIDAVDDVSCRPDFAIVIYPGGIVAKGTTELSPEIRVTDKTPPSFIVQAGDDPVNSDNSTYYFLALKRAKVPTELHIYATGGHGFGMKKTGKPSATWPDRCAEWMTNQGILPQQATK
jgi:acetyl esterase/lipase